MSWPREFENENIELSFPAQIDSQMPAKEKNNVCRHLTVQFLQNRTRYSYSYICYL